MERLFILKRFAFKDTYTIGKLYNTDGSYFCDTLEDKDRNITSDMPLSDLYNIKVYGQTAIPYGKYRISITYWDKYKKYYPLLHDVPAYLGILIHGGTNDKDTLGCILLGENKIVGQVINSIKYVRAITNQINDFIKNEDDVFIEIRKEAKKKTSGKVNASPVN